MGTNNHMSDMKVDQPASSPMANMMKKMIKDATNIGKLNITAGLGIFGLASGLVGLFGFDNQTRRLRFKSLKH